MIFFQFLHGGMNLREAVFTIRVTGTDPRAARFEETSSTPRFCVASFG